MYDTLELSKQTLDYLNNLWFDENNGYDMTISLDIKLVQDLLTKLLAHPFVLESSCKECEYIQNSMDNLCEYILQGNWQKLGWGW